MRVFLTGATGLLGSHIAQQLLSRGIKVTVLVRAIPQKSFLGQYRDQYKDRIEIIEGDLNQCLVAGSFDVVIHAAAMTSVDHTKSDEIWNVNLNGTKKLFQSLQGRFGTWVQISSISTMCDGGQVLVDESLQGRVRKTPYAESKLAADNWLSTQREQVLTIHPCYLLGQWDSKPSSGAIFHALKFKKISSFQNSIKNFVSPRDVAVGILGALDRGLSGHYILGNENVPLDQFFKTISREMNIPMDIKEEPLTLTSPDWAKEFCAAAEVNWSKAKSEISYNPKVSLAEMVRETMDYFEQHKMLRRNPPSK
ncbi:MAG: NAD-dependent epimerase/dehydratase family protein [Bdellovibrionales bacterium]|nr:NAD-dependent epimerase/dehydratase family protein [Bdellovibrionales bacterium]